MNDDVNNLLELPLDQVSYENGFSENKTNFSQNIFFCHGNKLFVNIAQLFSLRDIVVHHKTERKKNRKEELCGARIAQIYSGK